MATTTVLSNPTVSVNSVDLSDQCTSAVVTESYESQDVTTFGDTARKFTKGLGMHEITLTLFASYGASEVEATLDAVVGTTTNIVIKSSSAAVSASNPEYTLTGAYLESFTPVNANVGEMSTIEVTFTGGALTRSTGA